MISLSGYKISLCDENEKNSIKIKDLTEDFCSKLVKMKDSGTRFSNSSRYTYHTEYDSINELQCGTARAAVIRVIINLLKPENLNQFIKIHGNFTN